MNICFKNPSLLVIRVPIFEDSGDRWFCQNKQCCDKLCSSYIFAHLPYVHNICQRTKLKQFSNKFDVFYSRENNSWIGGGCASQAVEHISQQTVSKKSNLRQIWAY